MDNLRGEIARLGERLVRAEVKLAWLEITRETVAEILGGTGTRPAVEKLRSKLKRLAGRGWVRPVRWLATQRLRAPLAVHGSFPRREHGKLRPVALAGRAPSDAGIARQAVVRDRFVSSSRLPLGQWH